MTKQPMDRATRRLGERLERVERILAGMSAPQLADSSIEDGGLRVHDADGNLVTIIGKRPDGTYGVGYNITETEITDGAITTPKIAANAVTADQISAVSVAAAVGDFIKVTAENIDADALNGTTITGATVQTDADVAANGGIRLRPGTMDYNKAIGQAVVQLYTGNPSERLPAEIAAIADGPADSDNISLLITSPAKQTATEAPNQAKVQLYGGDADTAATATLGAGAAYVVAWGASADPGAVSASHPIRLDFEEWHLVGAAGEPPFLNGWTAYTNGESWPQFVKDSAGVVHITGRVATISNASVIFNLPEGYRPPFDCDQRLAFQQAASPMKYGSIRVFANGDVKFWTEGNTGGTYVSLEGISFPTLPTY